MRRFVKIYNKIDDIKDIWNKLYFDGYDMTPYQSFDWNKNVMECYKSNTYIFLNFTVKYFICFKDDRPVIIAPLAVPKSRNNKENYIQILGQYTKSGALNFIYDNEASNEDFDFLIEYIQKKYPKEIRFYEIGDYTKFNKFLSSYNKAQKISDRICVRCNIPVTKEGNYNSLSKSVRQSLRTSHNRLAKEGLVSKVDIFRGYCFKKNELDQFSYLYNKREAEWNNKQIRLQEHTKPHLLNIIARKILRKVFKNKDALINFSRNEKFILVKCVIDGNLAGYFYAVSDEKGYCIVPTLVIDSYYGKYNPGLMMIYEFINNCIDEKSLSVFDLSRGDEIYKSRYIPKAEKYLNNDYKVCLIK